MRIIILFWLLFVANSSFAQDVDLGIELAVRPSVILSVDQTGLLDITITNYGPTEIVGSISVDGILPSVNFLSMVSGECKPVVFSPPPPGTPYFGLYRTPPLLVEDSVTCTFPFQLDSSLPQSTIIGMKVRPYPSSTADSNQSNDTASINVRFIGVEPIPALRPTIVWLLAGLILILGVRRVRISKI